MKAVSSRNFCKTALLTVLGGALLLGAPGASRATEPDHDTYTALHAFSVGHDPKALSVWCDRHLTLAQNAIDRLLSVSGPRTVANTLRPFDDANAELTLAYNETFMMFSLEADAGERDQAQLLSQKVSSAATALSLNHDVYEALKAVPEETLDPATRNLLARSLLEFRLSGVDRSAAVRDQLQELQDRINETSSEFYRNIANDVHRVVVPRAELDGLPADFIARHPVDEKGNVTVTTEETDVGPIASFANSADLRHKIAVAYDQRAYPANRMVLLNLLQARYELATLLGYKSFADLDLADQMIGSSDKAKTFLAEVDSATREPAAHEYRRLLKFAQSRDPSIKVINEADWRYWIEQYRRSVYQFDAQSVRAYFPYDEVQAGVLRTAGHMFHVEFKPIVGSTLWDASVSEYAVMDRGRKIGVIYLDMHPRVGKDKGNSAAPLVPGIRGRQLPEGVLMCNFPGGVAGDAGLMEYGSVVTFIHEFGHLMHHILGGQGAWAMQEGENVERDFVEAPSQMLETFFSDPKVLDSFARRLDTEEPIPAELVQRMNEASAFGRAMSWRRQLLFANYALQLHDAEPSTLDFDQLFSADTKRFTPIEEVDGNHRYTSFMHLPSYGAKYYTYVLDKVIALDFFDQFDKNDLLDGPAAMRYRHAVLDPGSSRPAGQLVQDFLGRPEKLEAFKEWLNLEFDAGQPGAHVHF